MKLLVTAAAIAAALGASAGVSAATFDFSYTFTDRQAISGSLDGTLNGTTIDNISNLHVALNGIDFAGGTDSNGATSLQIFGYDSATQLFDAPAVLSTVSSKNNFQIADESPTGAAQANYFFSFVNDPSFGALIGAGNFLHSDSFSGPGATQSAADFADGGTWKVSAVPVPAALPLLLSGLGLLGLRRRRAA